MCLSVPSRRRSFLRLPDHCASAAAACTSPATASRSPRAGPAQTASVRRTIGSRPHRPARAARGEPGGSAVRVVDGRAGPGAGRGDDHVRAGVRGVRRAVGAAGRRGRRAAVDAPARRPEPLPPHLPGAHHPSVPGVDDGPRSVTGRRRRDPHREPIDGDSVVMVRPYVLLPATKPVPLGPSVSRDEGSPTGQPDDQDGEPR